MIFDPLQNLGDPPPRRYQNHITRLGWLSQLCQYVEAHCTDSEYNNFLTHNERAQSTNTTPVEYNQHRRGLFYRNDAGEVVKATHVQAWRQNLGLAPGRYDRKKRYHQSPYVLAALGRNKQRAKAASVILAFDQVHLEQLIFKYQEPNSINTSRAYLFKQIPRVISATLAMALHDQKVLGKQGLFALVGLKTNGTRRHYNRLKSNMGKHLCSPGLSLRLDDIIELLSKTRIILDGEDMGFILQMVDEPMYITGQQINQNTHTNVRGGYWRMCQFNQQLFHYAFRHFMQLDVRCYQLQDQDFNVYLNAKSAHHMAEGKRTGQSAQTVLFNAQQLIQRSGLSQLTQKSTWQEHKHLLRALKRMKALGLIEDYGQPKTSYKSKDLWLRFPPHAPPD